MKYSTHMLHAAWYPNMLAAQRDGYLGRLYMIMHRATRDSIAAHSCFLLIVSEEGRGENINKDSGQVVRSSVK